MSRRSIMIPVKESDEQVEIFLDELPEDAADILDILMAEIAPLDLWLKFAVEYYKQGKVDNFKLIMAQGTDTTLEEWYKDSKSERIALVNALASYYTLLGAKEKDKKKKEDNFSHATQNFSKADKIDPHEFLTWVGKGILLLYRGEFDRALYNFDTVLQTNPENIAALLGKACVQFNKGQYEAALLSYAIALKKNPACPAAVRLGLAYSYYKLNRTDLAKQAFERVVELDPKNADALVALAVFDINEGAIVPGMKKLKAAYEANNTNPMVLNHLANHFFFKKDFAKVQNLALLAYHSTEIQEIKAESCYLIARCHHVQEEYEKAYEFYGQALRHWKEHTLAKFGLGKMYLQRGQPEQALPYFEQILQTHPDNFDAVKMVGLVNAQLKKKDKAELHLKKATELQPNDYESWLELAQLKEATDYTAALTAYEKALNLMEKYHAPVGYELWNNIGVLRHKSKNFAGAATAYRSALNVVGAVGLEVRAQTVTILYNMARLFEDTHDITKAEELYKNILKEHPNYVDCNLRLGCIDRDRAQFYSAAEWYRDCLLINPDHAEAWALLGNMHLTKEEWQPGQKIFERILEKEKTDPYSLLSLGNIYYNAKIHNPEKEVKYHKLATDFYWRVLWKNPANIYAANGMGIVTAEKGDLALAKEFFSQIREAADSMPDVRLNLAHIHLGQGQFMNAVQLYQNCLKTFHLNKDETVLLYLAKAYFEWDKMEECKQTLMKAIHVQPQNHALWFNLALSQEALATAILKKPKKSITELSKAIRELELAIRTFDHLTLKPATAVSTAATTDGASIPNPEDPAAAAASSAPTPAVGPNAVRTNVSTTRAQRHLTFSRSRLADAKKQFEKQCAVEQEETVKREEQQKRLDELARKYQEEEDRAAQEAAERQRHEEELAQEVYQKNQLVVQKFVSEAATVNDNNNNEVEKEKERETPRKGRKKGGSRKKKEKPTVEEPDSPLPPDVSSGEDDTGMTADDYTAEGWEQMRDRRNPKAKEIAKRARERETEEKEKKRRRVHEDSDDENQRSDDENNNNNKSGSESEEEKPKKKRGLKKRNKRKVMEEEEEEEEEGRLEIAEEEEGEKREQEDDGDKEENNDNNTSDNENVEGEEKEEEPSSAEKHSEGESDVVMTNNDVENEGENHTVEQEEEAPTQIDSSNTQIESNNDEEMEDLNS